MLKRGVWIALGAAVLVLSTPRAGSAGIGELIWEMSGPQMVGGGLQCKFTPRWEREVCYVTLGFPGSYAALAVKPKTRLRTSLDGGVYVSTGKNSNGVDYTAGGVWMLAFDPMIEFVHHDNWLMGPDRAEIYHGLGMSYNRLFGKHMNPFNNAAIKVRPIGVRFGRNNLEFDIRIYPNRFNASDFNKTPTSPEDNGAEMVWGLSYGIAIGEYKK